MKDVKGKLVLITGAALGMGKLLTEKFCQNGAKVVMVDIRKEELKELLNEFRGRGYDVHDYICDISDSDQVHRMAEWTRQEFGTVSVLVNNAGVAYKGDLIEQTDGQLGKTVDVNFKALLWTMKSFLPGMIEQNEGHIINLASASGFVALPGGAVYGATKWAVIGLSESIHQEIINMEKNVKMTIVCPSFVNTGMFEGAKAPTMTKFLSPEKIVEAIYNGFKKDKLYVMEPFMVKLTPALKWTLPTKLFDFITRTIGISSSMKSFTGRD